MEVRFSAASERVKYCAEHGFFLPFATKNYFQLPSQGFFVQGAQNSAMTVVSKTSPLICQHILPMLSDTS